MRPVKSQGPYKKAAESEEEIRRYCASGCKMGPQAKKCRHPLISGKGNDNDSPLEPPAVTQPCLYLDFSPMLLILDFSPPELYNICIVLRYYVCDDLLQQ